MNRTYLLVVTVSVLVTAAACHKKVPVASVPPPLVDTPKEQARAAAPAPTPTPAPKPAPVAQAKPAPTPAPKPTVMPAKEKETLNALLAKLSDALFDFDKYDIRPDAATALKGDLDVIRGMMSDYPSQVLQIEGHADERGSEEYNKGLADRRAQATKEFLAVAGVSQGQLTVISYGKDKPVCSEQSEACYQRNRRTHIVAAP